MIGNKKFQPFIKTILIEIIILTIISVTVPVIVQNWLYPKLGLPHDSPIPLRILLVGFFVLYFLKKQGQTLYDLGYSKPKNWFIFTGFLILIIFLQIFLPGTIINSLGFNMGDYSFFEHVQGNLPALIFWIVMSWVIGAFFEELIFRVYLIDRFKRLVNHDKVGLIIAIIIQAIFFGLFHWYQGTGGVLSTAISGLISGTIYGVYKNIWPCVISHGLLNTVFFIAFYFNGV
ncbi:CPBP family intramembrane glutamic endopeptidase [uncultured Winogradskyella sp.]|uniref:CPBP family intramembrane glutamic endopeptidase n=1 Tax=uncultured Winogradskyella sp. TaxID=395353 RepID=UPI00262D4E8F|nr:CPBP family intramembrane glutamic endopeptidase [uncultured Winogradskyella sp.]